MKSKSLILGALVFIFAIGAALVYAKADAVESALAAANTHVHRLLGAQGGPSDHFGCHRHGTVTYHCH